ncbi:MAG: RluA family pseudouridine synthase [Pirellulaceae bacterium]|nr:RluA family pseudouridine synthase [Pirellulaceae bacterium]
MPKKPPSIVIHPQAPAPARRLVQVVSNFLRRTPARARREILAGNIYVNGQACGKPERLLKPGDKVELIRPVEEPRQKPGKVKNTPFPKKLEVIFEDAQLLVADKPAGLLSVATQKGDRKTMIALVESYLKKFDSQARIYSLQRLDRDVSGVMVFAKDEATYEALRGQFSANKPERKYVAIVSGSLKDDAGTFRSYLATGKHLTRHSVKNPKHGELAITHYRVIRRLEKETVVEVTLETGRRNQIRVQFAEAGHPVIGETRYRRMQAARPDWNPNRIALHANTLRVVHPHTNRNMEFCSPWPPVFKAFLKARKADA